jgi:ethanolamine ammonia-lyase large subunit/ethanolamine ammonia-lyase small subunit
MKYKYTIGGATYAFDDLRQLLANATPHRSGDVLAGVAAGSAQQRAAAQFALADIRLTDFLSEAVIPYETDEVTRLIIDTHSISAFQSIAHLTVGGLRDWLLSKEATPEKITAIGPGLTPEMAAAVVKIMRLQDLVVVAQKCRVVTKFRNTIGLPGRLSTRLQPNHPTDDLRGISASLLDGLLLGAGDAVIGINPATDSVEAYVRIIEMLDSFRQRFDMPSQSCVLSHITTAIKAMEAGAPVDLVFQSVAGSQAANRGFGIDLALLTEAHEMALSLDRGTIGNNVMYFETGQGSALSSNSNFGVDQQTIEARAYAVARNFSPLLVNSVVGFIGPEYLYNGKQITRAGLEDHCCGKLLGLPMGCDVCYTNHAEADQDDMDSLLTLLGVAGCTFVMGVPGADDIMLNYQSTSFHDALYVRQVLGKKPAPEFDDWLNKMGLFDRDGSRIQQAVISTADNLVVRSLIGSEPAQATNIARVDEPASVWDGLKRFTTARIGIEPTGVSQPTQSTLQFQWDHAQARDAVYSSFDLMVLGQQLAQFGLDTVEVTSQATNRNDYLLFPTHGRRLGDESCRELSRVAQSYDIVFVLADGLSANAVQTYGPEFLKSVFSLLPGDEWRVGPVVVARQARVAIGDDIAQQLGADMVVVIIGERPGLCSSDSMGLYMTWHPRVGTVDSERNCISNVRPGGLTNDEAAGKLLYLMHSARRLKLSGVALKEDPIPAFSAAPKPYQLP